MRKQITFLQCQKCGKIYQFPRIMAIDKLYVQSYCPECGATTALNLGNKEEDIPIYINPNLDERFFIYD